MKINKIGIELEGEFITSPYEETFQNWNVSDDGSLRSTQGGYMNELVSEPFEASGLDSVLGELEPLVVDGDRFAYSNKSAGTHIHVSLADDKDYELMRSYDFYKAFVKAYAERFTLSKYAERFSNRFCEGINRQREFVRYTNEQKGATSRIDARYKAINYCQAYHGTIEFRLFPYVVTIEGLKEIVDFVVGLVESYAPDTSGAELLEEWARHDFLIIPEKRNITYELWKEIIGDYTGNYQLQDGYIQLDKGAMSFDLIQLLNKTTVVKFEDDK